MKSHFKINAELLARVLGLTGEVVAVVRDPMDGALIVQIDHFGLYPEGHCSMQVTQYDGMANARCLVPRLEAVDAAHARPFPVATEYAPPKGH